MLKRSLKFKMWLTDGTTDIIGGGGISLLKAIDEYGSISDAARKIGMSYRFAWNQIKEIERAIGQPILKTKVGGKYGGNAELTSKAKEILKEYDKINKYLSQVLQDKNRWEWIGLKISARNRLKGIVEDVEKGSVTSKVKIKIETPVTITSVITKEAVEDLELKRGDKVEAIVKSTEVMVSKE
ncbi:TOBE domain-containing protein [[Eubacterium] cellulosolvens]